MGRSPQFDVTCRNLSAGGLAFLHRGFLHAGTECQIRLPLMTGGEMTVHGRIVQCAHVQKSIHEVGVVFDEAIDPRQFLDVGAEDADLNKAPPGPARAAGAFAPCQLRPTRLRLVRASTAGHGDRSPELYPSAAGREPVTADRLRCDLLRPSLHRDNRGGRRGESAARGLCEPHHRRHRRAPADSFAAAHERRCERGSAQALQSDDLGPSALTSICRTAPCSRAAQSRS